MVKMCIGKGLNFVSAVCFMLLITTSLALAAAPKGLVGHGISDEGTGEVVKDSSAGKMTVNFGKEPNGLKKASIEMETLRVRA